MKVVFRVDASSQIGTGHFMRCLTLAEELKKQGAHILFLNRNLPVYLGDMLIAKGIEYVSLCDDDIAGEIDELAHASWLTVSQAQDAKTTIKAISGQTFDWMIVDHYALDIRWESVVRPNVRKIMVIDDLADRCHDCDILLDQNYYVDMQTRYNGKVSASCQLLLGSKYALLREEFRSLREQVKVRSGEIEKVLVFFGGVDADNYTLSAIQALAEVDAGVQVDVVIGAQHPFREKIKSACSANGFLCHVQTSRMAELMLDADLMVGAGGSTSWERCCLGLPSLLISLADNQIAIAKGLSDVGVCVYDGNRRGGDFKKSLTQLITKPKQIRKMSQNAFMLTDGLGVFRVINEMRLCL